MSQKIKTSVEIDGSLSASQIPNATVDTDKFLVSDGGFVKHRTGAQVLSDLGITLDTATKLQHQVKAGVAINKGQAVYVTDADGTNMIVGLASNSAEATSSKTMGLIDATVSINGFANVITEGLLDGLNTLGATVGNPVWLGTDGNLIYGLSNKPHAPNHLVFIGIVTRVNANNGEIFVKVQNGFELDELHNVDLITTAPSGNDILAFEGAPTNLWKNKTISSVLGYTPYNASNPAGYISSYTETDPTVPSYVKSITSTEKSNWNTAFGWGNHASAGYLTSSLAATTYVSLSGSYSNPSWITSLAYSKISGVPSFLTSESDTLSTVTSRGSSTSTQITLSGAGDNSTTYSSLRFAGYNQGGGVGYHGFFEIQNTYASATNSKKFFRIDSAGTLQIINSAYTSNIFNLTDSGVLTTSSFIKSGGTSAQILAADGSVITAGTGITISGGTISSSASGGVTSFNTRTGAVTLSSGDVTTALGYTPVSSLTDTLSTVASRGNVATVSLAGRNSLLVNKSDGSAGGQLSYDSSINQLYLWNSVATGYFSIYTNNSERLNIATGGAVTANVDMRAPIFYDSNDTTYYVDPNSDSKLNRAIIGNGTNKMTIGIWDGVNNRIEGVGLPLFLTSYGGSIKFGYSGNTQMELSTAGNLAVGGTISASGTGGFASSTYVTAARNPIWRFGNADGYGLSYFQGTAGNGGLDTIGLHFGTATAYGSPFQFRSDGYAYASAYLEGGSSLRAPIFYDSNNTGYYVDPASTTQLNILNVANIYYSGYNTASGIGNNSFNTAKTILGNIHVNNGSGVSGNSYQAAITFQGGNANEAQAGIYVSNNSSIGTAMGFATTDSYATGPQLFLYSYNDGTTFFPRSYSQSNGSFRAPMFYDSNNTGYYVDPASTSNLNGLNVGGSSVVVNNGGTYSINITGTSATSSWLSASSLSSNGYNKFANGFTIQWGFVSISANTRTTISYPVGFTSAYSITASSDWGPTGAGGWAIAGATLSSSSSFIAWNAGDSSTTIYWIAVGTI